MRNLSKKVLLLVIILTFIFTLVGCSRKKYTEGIFIYYRLDDGGVDIVGLTPGGQELETIIFPTSIDDAKYVNIGDTIGEFMYWPSITSDSLKIAIIGNVNMVGREALYDIDTLERVIVNSCNVVRIQSNFCKIKIIVPFDLYDNYIETYKGNFISGFVKSRVCFYYNYKDSPNNDLYWTSYDNEGEMITKPTDPKLDRYEFKGWYLDKECTQQFDFIDEQNKSIIETKLYAKWEG